LHWLCVVQPQKQTNVAELSLAVFGQHELPHLDLN
jgi:hypothetical protein